MGKRNRILKVRVTDNEYKIIMENCIKSGRSVSELLRECACEKEITVIGGLDKIISELRHQGNNLNQLTIMARQGNINLVNFSAFEEVYHQTWQALNSLLSHVV